MRRAAALLLPLVAGGLIGLSVSPLQGWWYGALGAAAAPFALRRPSPRGRALAGLLLGLGQFSVGLAWALQFSTPGYVVLVLVESLFFALAAALVVTEDALLLPSLVGALTLAEWARQSWPFGGLPLGSAALGQMGGPLQFAARLGGPLAVLAVLLAGAGGLSALLVPLALPVLRRRSWLAAGAVSLAASIALSAGGALASPGAPRPRSFLTAAVVQGGGVRGLDELEVPPSHVFAAALRETARVRGRPQLILWPEDTVSTGPVPFPRSAERSALSALAARRKATVVVGAVYDVGARRFRNEIVAIGPSGHIVAVFEKVHRVPFGEYVPARSFFAHFANLSDIPRDAVVGHGSGMIATPAGRFAVLVSYEDFFSSRGRSGVRAGGEVILVPTNTSSYSNDEAPLQELAASRLQAIEEGRYLLQAAPTGFSAVVAPSGTVLERTRLSAPGVIEVRLPRLGGLTPYGHLGDLPVVTLAALLLGVPLALSLRRRLGAVPRRPSGRSRAAQ